MNCQFCYTGRMGLSGNLSTAQIVEQMVVACRVLAAEPGDDKDKATVTNVVFMGMGGESADNLPQAPFAASCMFWRVNGVVPARVQCTVVCWLSCVVADVAACLCAVLCCAEPLDNLESVMAAVDIMTHPLGLHMSRQKVGEGRKLCMFGVWV